MTQAYILDACAIIALLKGEAGADIVEGILTQPADKSIVYMCKLNLLEMYYGFYRTDGLEVAEKRFQAVANSSVVLISELTDIAFRNAGRLKATYKMSLGDSILLGEALSAQLTVVTSDHHEFDKIEENESLNFLWIR